MNDKNPFACWSSHAPGPFLIELCSDVTTYIEKALRPGAADLSRFTRNVSRVRSGGVFGASWVVLDVFSLSVISRIDAPTPENKGLPYWSLVMHLS